MPNIITQDMLEGKLEIGVTNRQGHFYIFQWFRL